MQAASSRLEQGTKKPEVNVSITETTTQRGYGYKQHQKTRKNLLFNLVDGTECEYCGKPMFRAPDKNFDGAALEADHVDRDKTQPPKRLIHRKCNRTLNGLSLIHI